MTKEGIFSHLITEICSISSIAEELTSMPSQFEIKHDTRLVDLGINSIDYAEIIYNLSNKWNLELSVDSFVNACRVQDVVNLIHDKMTN